MITLKQGMKISAIIDKLNLKMPDAKDQEQLGADLLLQVLSKAHKAEKEIYELVADIRGCTAKEAQEIDLAEFVQELLGDAGMRDFFSSAVASPAQK